MIVRPIVRVLGAAAVALFALAHGSQAQQRPPQQPQAQPQAEQPKQASPAAIALATQLLELKGAIGAFDAAIEGVITHNKGNLLQINPNLTRDIDATAQTVRAEASARRQELRGEIARGYASVFSEQELKEKINELTRYIEPMMIMLMGLLIGGVTLALLLPIFTISKVVAS